MSDTDMQNFDTRLLDLHLGHLSRAEQDEFRRRIADDPALRAQHEALTSVFEALGAVRHAPPAPPDLAARIAQRVRSAGRPPRVIRPADEVTAAVERNNGGTIRLSNLREIVAVAAVLVLAIGVGVPGLMHMQERGQRLGCSRNLQVLGVGVQQYANVFNASLPFTGWNGHASWQPSDEPGVDTIPNRRHMYPLLRLAYVQDPRFFICPAQQHMPMPRHEIARHDDFLEARNVSYAYQNMAGVRPTLRDNPSLPIVSDDNPLFAEGIPLLDVRRLGWGGPENSRAHGGAGQNILTLDGRVIWAKTPLAGIDGDNIWTLDDVTEYTGHEGPRQAADAHLLR